MRFRVKVKPHSGKSSVEKIGEEYFVHLKSFPENNKANLELVKVLKKYFKKSVKIISGFTSRNKVIEVED